MLVYKVEEAIIKFLNDYNRNKNQQIPNQINRRGKNG